MIRLTREQVRNIDRAAVERYKIPSILLMENAARAATDVAIEMLGGGDIKGGRNGAGDTTIEGTAEATGKETAEALILCGGGNNGGDGLAVARHLHLRGIKVTIALTVDEKTFKGDAKINFDIVRAMNLNIRPADGELPELIRATPANLIIDAIFGTGLNRPPKSPFDQLVAAVKQSGKPVLAIDVPSGLDCDTGQPLGPCIEATRTITFVAEKIGFANPATAKFLGVVSVGDIGCPWEIEDGG